jgi:hypothetical protein
MDFEKMASAMADEEIVATINIFYEEQQRRRRIKRQKLIDNFRHAFSELRDAGISLRYDDPNCMEASYLEDWDNFEFD